MTTDDETKGSRFLFIVLEHFPVVLCLEVSCFLASIRARIPVFPFLLLLFVNFLDLGVLMSELQGLNLVLLVFLYVFRIIWHDLQLVRHFELVRRVSYFNLFLLFARIAHWSQSMQFHYLLGIVFFILDQIAFFEYLFDDARIKLSVSRIDSLAVSAFLKQFFIGLFQHLQQVGLQFYHFIGSVPLNFSCLLLDIHFLDDRIFPFSIFQDEALGQFSDIAGSEQIDTQGIGIDLFFLLPESRYLLLQSSVNILLHSFQLFLFFFFCFFQGNEQIDLGF